MSNRTIDFAGRKMILHPSGSIFWPDQATLIVGDLHFEKASWYHSSGQFLPPYDSSETLKKLETVMSEFSPKRLILLGDVFHDNDAWHRMVQTDKERLTLFPCRGMTRVADGRDRAVRPWMTSALDATSYDAS